VISRRVLEPVTHSSLYFPNEIHRDPNYNEPNQLNTYNRKNTSKFNSTQSEFYQLQADRCFERLNVLFSKSNKLWTLKGNLMYQLSNVYVVSDQWYKLCNRNAKVSARIEELKHWINQKTDDCDYKWQRYEQYLLSESICNTPGSSFTFVLLNQVNGTEYLEYSSKVDKCWKQEHFLREDQDGVGLSIKNCLNGGEIRTNQTNLVLQSLLRKLGQIYGLISEKHDQCQKLELSNLRFKLINSILSYKLESI